MSQLEFDDNAARTLEAMYLTPDVVGQRAKVIEMLSPVPGEHVLDIGAGPGLLACDLARMVGESGRLVGLDASAAMLKAARTRLAAMPQAEGIAGDPADLRAASSTALTLPTTHVPSLSLLRVRLTTPL